MICLEIYDSQSKSLKFFRELGKHNLEIHLLLRKVIDYVIAFTYAEIVMGFNLRII